jgi:hypothetical protein
MRSSDCGDFPPGELAGYQRYRKPAFGQQRLNSIRRTGGVALRPRRRSASSYQALLIRNQTRTTLNGTPKANAAKYRIATSFSDVQGSKWLANSKLQGIKA